VNVNGFIGRLHLPTLAVNQNDFTWDDYSLYQLRCLSVLAQKKT